MNLPDRAEIVVIGGGIIGCSTAYHLARDHKADVVLLEQGKLTSRLDLARRRPRRAIALVGLDHPGAEIFGRALSRLEAETGLATGWKMTGCLRLATNADRWTEFKRLATTARSFGMDMHLLSPAEVKAMWPLMETGDLVGASWLPTDGQASPSDITQSLAKGARMHGARIFEGVRVTGFVMDGRRIRKVDDRSRATSPATRSSIAPGNGRARSAHMAGINVPLQPVRHQYIITREDPRAGRRARRRSATRTGAPISRKRSAAW